MSGSSPRINKIEAISLLNSGNLPGTFVDVAKVTAPNTLIANRALIPDLANDCSVRLGNERIQVYQLFKIQDEFGSLGEPVFGAVNDERGLIRFVGKWQNNSDVLGTYVSANFDTLSYYEVTFYGTGLNVLMVQGGAVQQQEVSVDGGAYGGNIIPTVNEVIDSRNYTTNHVFTLASGLSLGFHTVRVKNTNASNIISMVGVEILNEQASGLLNIRPGTVLGNNSKATLASVVNSAYNTFDVGTLGTKGGHALVYLNTDGTVSKAITPTDATQLNLTSADHSNEEIIRTHHWSEFGIGLASDFSRADAGSINDRAFTLNDGTTTLFALTGSYISYISGIGRVLGLNGTAGTYHCSITFVGTGLDITATNDGASTSDTIAAYVNGSSIGNLISGAGYIGLRKIKVVSGLPYGTHTVKLVRSAANTATFYVENFIVYGPKKPTLPTGSVEMADYYVMADYVRSTTLSQSEAFETPSTGTLCKHPSREAVYVGSGWNIAGPPSIRVRGTTNGDYVEHTFFGTGIEIWASFGSVVPPLVVQIDGVNYTGAASTSDGSWVGGTSTWTFVTGGGNLSIIGLALGRHKIRVSRGATGDNFTFYGFGIITPIHSPKSNSYAVYQNTLPVGSCSISDSKRLNTTTTQKAWARVNGIVSSPTTTSSTFVPLPDMNLTIRTFGNPLDISAQVCLFAAGGSADKILGIYVDGVFFSQTGDSIEVTAGDRPWLHLRDIIPVGAGVHKIEIVWRGGGSTLTAQGSDRFLIVKEI